MQADEQPTITQAEFQRLQESDPRAAFTAYAQGRVQGSHILTPQGREQMEESRRESQRIAALTADSFSSSMSAAQMRAWSERMGLSNFAPVAPTDVPNNDEDTDDDY